VVSGAAVRGTRPVRRRGLGTVLVHGRGWCSRWGDASRAAERELVEETGLQFLTLVGPYHRRGFEFLNHGAPQAQVEEFFAARTTTTDLSVEGWTDLERRAMTAWRWWSVHELRNHEVRYFPDNLIDLVLEADRLV
jgi:8-oxo-dGTP pyrophosphatase MutT (NUDIX family)